MEDHLRELVQSINRLFRNLKRYLEVGEERHYDHDWWTTQDPSHQNIGVYKVLRYHIFVIPVT